MLSLNKALSDIDWTPQFRIEDGYRASYDRFLREGRGRYRFDFAADATLLAKLSG